MSAADTKKILTRWCPRHDGLQKTATCVCTNHHVPIEESIAAIKSMCDFAYEQGYHEMGYEPLDYILKYISGLDMTGHMLVEENNRLRSVLHLIAKHGGKTTTAEGLTCNGSWCGEQANAILTMEATMSTQGGTKTELRATIFGLQTRLAKTIQENELLKAHLARACERCAGTTDSGTLTAWKQAAGITTENRGNMQ